MSGIVIFSDMHFVSQFLEEQVRVANDIFTFSKECRADAIIYNGDVFETKNRIDVTLYNTVWSLFHDFYISTDIPVIINTGNHDIISTNRESSLKPFSAAVAKLITRPEIFMQNNILITAIPYGMDIHTPTKSTVSDRINILFLHDFIDVFTPDNFNISSWKADALSDFTYVFSGHIHKPAQYKNIYSIGSSFMTDFGEEGEQKRFLYLSDEGVQSIPIDCPQYITLDGLSDSLVSKLMKDDKNIFRINVSPELLSHPVFKKFNVRPNVIKSEKSETRLGSTSSIEEEIMIYVEQSKTTLSKEKLLKIGNILHRSI